MENQENEIQQEEVINPEQFQAGPAGEENLPEQDDTEYTEEETPFADGEGSALAEEFDVPEKEDRDEDQNA